MKEKIEVARASLDFYKYEEDGFLCYEFDATACQPPEPMVNAIVGLSMLKNQNEKLIGIFFHEPTPLYDRIGSEYSHTSFELENGDVKVVFQKASK